MKFTRFEAETSIGYQFVKSKSDNKNLVVVFPGRKETGRKPWPEYVIELASYDVNKLFLVDDLNDISISPFILLNGEYTVEHTVKALIDKCVFETGATNIIVAGSSAGGTAAIYYGMKYNYSIIASSGGLSIGDIWMSNGYEDRLNLVMGGTTEQKKAQLNQLVPDVMKEHLSSYKGIAVLNYGNDEPIVKVHKDVDLLEQILSGCTANVKITFSDFAEHLECVRWLSQNFRALLDEMIIQ